MTRPVAVLRPEPGNGATAERLHRRGLQPIRLPLFETKAIAWSPVDPSGFDALVLTSANAVRHAGAGLGSLSRLPVLAVGEATAAAAREAGLVVRHIGTGDAAGLVAAARETGLARMLHLGGRETTIVAENGIARSIPVYASDILPVSHGQAALLPGSVAMLHSARAAAAFIDVIDRYGLPRGAISIAALSAAVATAAGRGWWAVATAADPDDAALIDTAARLAD